MPWNTIWRIKELLLFWEGAKQCSDHAASKGSATGVICVGCFAGPQGTQTPLLRTPRALQRQSWAIRKLSKTKITCCCDGFSPESKFKDDFSQYKLVTASNKTSPLHTGLKSAVKNSFRVQSLISFSHGMCPGNHGGLQRNYAGGRVTWFVSCCGRRCKGREGGKIQVPPSEEEILKVLHPILTGSAFWNLT